MKSLHSKLVSHFCAFNKVFYHLYFLLLPNRLIIRATFFVIYLHCALDRNVVHVLNDFISDRTVNIGSNSLSFQIMF